MTKKKLDLEFHNELKKQKESLLQTLPIFLGYGNYILFLLE